MLTDAIVASVLGVVSSIAVGAALIGLRGAVKHRDETTQHRAAIAVIDTRLGHIDSSISHVAASLDRLETHVSALPCRGCQTSHYLPEKSV